MGSRGGFYFIVWERGRQMCALSILIWFGLHFGQQFGRSDRTRTQPGMGNEMYCIEFVCVTLFAFGGHWFGGGRSGFSGYWINANLLMECNVFVGKSCA